MHGRVRSALFAMLFGALLLTAHAAAQVTTPPEPADGSDAIEVKISFLLIDLTRILDAEQAVEADLFYRIEWNDSRLASEAEDVRRVDVDSIWSPLLEPIAPRDVSILLPETVAVNRNGDIVYIQ